MMNYVYHIIMFLFLNSIYTLLINVHQCRQADILVPIFESVPILIDI